MLIQSCLGRLFCAPESGVGESGAAATALDNVVSPDEYSVTDPGGEGELESLPAKDKPADKADESAAKADIQDSGSDESTPDEAAEGETPSSDEPAEEEAPFSDELLDRAVALGYTFADIKHFRSEQSLERDVSRAERLAQRVAARKSATETKTDSKTPEPKEPKEPNWDEKKAAGYDEWQIDQMKADYQRSVEAYQKAMEAHEGVEQLKQYQMELQAEREQEAWNAKIQRFEMNVANLVSENKGYEDLLGKGSAEGFKKSSKEFQNRNRLLRRQLTIENEYLNAGMRVPSEKRVLQEALGSLFNGHSQEIARKKLKQDIKEASSQALVRTSSAGSKPARGIDAVLEKTERFLRENP